jgi:putative PEP-CTERM system histidine kinase
VDAVLLTHALCAVAYLALGLLLAVHSSWRAPLVALVGAALLTGCWALAVALDAPAGSLRAVSCGAWVLFLAVACHAGLPEGESARRLLWGAVPAALAWAFLMGLQITGHSPESGRESGGLFVAALWGRLLVAVAGLYFTELLLRGSSSEMRWRIKHVCIGVGALLAWDVFTASEALLLRRVSPGLEASRGAVALIVAPLIALGAARTPTWSAQLRLARRAVVHSVVLVGIGVYLLGLAAAGVLLRAVGGDWAMLLQASVLFSGLLALVVLLASDRARTTARRAVSSYLFTYRHDYRETWRRFTASLAGADRDESLRERALRAVATVVDSPGGGLWIRKGGRFVREAGIWVPDAAEDPATDSAFALELAARGEGVLDLGRPGQPGRLREAAWVPGWLRDWSTAWVIVPLLHRHQLLGFMVLVRRDGRTPLHAEDCELLETVASHAAGHLAEEQQTRTLAEGRRFAELSRGLAFIAHDLRNLANELSLTLANARKHIANPEFQRDMLLSMEDSVAAMQRLLDRLKSGGMPAQLRAPSDLAQLLGDSLRVYSEQGPVRLELEPRAALWVAADPDRVVAMAGHLVRNAVEAAGPDGEVAVRLRREGEHAVVEVVDDGPGMTPEFLRERLFHPFGSSKANGFGIGLYECRKLAEEMGGELDVDSSPGRGTRACLRIPLAAGAGPSDA